MPVSKKISDESILPLFKTTKKQDLIHWSCVEPEAKVFVRSMIGFDVMFRYLDPNAFINIAHINTANIRHFYNRTDLIRSNSQFWRLW